jgi:hypothetical protein
MPRKWTEAEILEEALRYSTRSEFYSNSSAYKAARRLGILDKVCAHMTVILKNWTLDELKEAAIPFNSRRAFAKGNPNAYSVAQRRPRKWL